MKSFVDRTRTVTQLNERVGRLEEELRELETLAAKKPRAQNRVSRRARNPLDRRFIEVTMSLPFSKLSGTGNDFLIIDNREGAVAPEAMADFVRSVCRRAVSVGADGVIFVEHHPDLDFKWRYFNADGGEAEMCGNGSRCVARWAFEKGIAGKSMRWETVAGVIHAEIVGEKGARVKLTGAKDYRPIEVNGGAEKMPGFFLNTGVPHTIFPVADVQTVDVRALGRKVRHDGQFAPAGTNASFVQVVGDNELVIRTYERGVEDETLACGTGCVAAAASMVFNKKVHAPVALRVRSGETVRVDLTGDDPLGGELWLEGDVRWVYDGVLREAF
ncbi:MAG: diaminopimelate epimerase [Deltaproteobacteria bacterium]|nr:diaminopimelate epimerase [Deltaproteobacteria bacterium]